MRVVKLLAVLFFASTLTALLVLTPDVTGQSGPTEAPVGFDNQTNGFEPQGDPNNPNPQPNTFVDDKRTFEKRDTPETGLGPVYNAQSCAECHQNPVTGAISQIFELRAGRNSTALSGSVIVISPSRSPTRDAFAAPSMDAVAAPNTFVPAPGGSIIQARAVDASIQERVADGPRIIFSGTQQLVSVMGFDGGQYGAVGNSPVDGLYPSFSPDGAQVVFQRNSNIFVMNNDGTNLHQITNTGLDASPAWSPNGTKIAFASRRTGRWQIFLMNEDGTSQVNISNSSANDTLPAWSFSGANIAFTRAPLAVPVEKIWTMTSAGGSQTQITTGAGNDERATYSPDNSSIAFSTDRDGNWEIYKIPASGGTATRLTNNPAADTNPAWSPDNSAVAFASNRSGTTRIWATSPDGSIQTQISADIGDQPSYSRDTGDSVRTFRSSLNVLGDGFVEATDDSTFLAIRDAQPSTMRGTAINVPLLEATGQTRLGRFGWKNSIASLLSFSAAAYLGEVGVTSPLQPVESTSLGRNVMPFDLVADPEDTGGDQGFGEDVEAFTRFMRSTKAPPRDRLLVPVDATDPGSALFDSLSCSVCHVRSITTAPVGTVSNGGTFVVPAALGDKVFHPFGDFLLHDIGTGDGIVETNGETTRNMMRTPPLWGVRTRDRLMHDGGSSSPPTNSGAQSFTFNEAILRHAGQASSSRTAYQALTPLQKGQLIRFLKSL
jgi:hypothetical protein